MSVNSSSNSSFYPPVKNCFMSRSTISILTALHHLHLILYLGYQRWRKQRSQAVMNSHSDIFTFHMVTLELVGILGFCLYCCGTYGNLLQVIKMGLYTLVIISPVQTLFHLLTCVDRYLAVVHPVVYLGLRQTSRVRIRSIISGCVWLLCIASVTQTISLNLYISLNFVFLSVSFTIVSFCSISVLCVLIRPGPGEVGKNKEKADQSKQKAFNTIIAITGVLFSWFLTILVFDIVLTPSVVMSVSSWLSLPSSLVLPLLFLHCTGKLSRSKRNTGSD